jgi:cytochrome c-type protein NapC
MLLLPVALAVFTVSDAQAQDVDWGKVQGKTIKVFYPGVASWEFVRGDDHGTGAVPIRTLKKACADCHVGQTGDYDINADKIIAGTLKKSSSKEPFEPAPLAGMPGFKDVQVKAAYDAQNIYLWFQWQGSGASVADPSLAKDDKADTIAIQINNTIKSFALVGCFMTCHNDENGMPENHGNDVKLYGYYTRDDSGALKPQDALDQNLAKKQFVDLWDVEFAGNSVKAGDEYILQSRSEDAQKDVSATGTYANGAYTVVMSRKLVTGDKNDIDLADGTAFQMGIAIHDNKNSGRKHYVSFPLSIGLSSSAEVAAQKL